ncbi:hypothetical protein A3709_18920 [Halioglobus sp. HI00S01]|uniref:hypothetical protein n=1 Tax=Halioglobus sp. HI00S01 TaxID=1822214 RepID=UPI0007C2A152|nr:hypothetical protein [Halioglobus sp. HI00S01]KZX57697.1 hypothetical protein A3709_18920 [Halioglobus sp. HI00S01]
MTLKASDNERIERIERFHSIGAGEYWRSTTSLDQFGVPEGQVLLITSVRHVDNAPHTVVLRPHPSQYDTYVKVTTGGGDQRSRSFKEYRLLVDEFVAQFEYLSREEADQVRHGELDAAQGRVTQAQQDLNSVLADPAALEEKAREALQDNSEPKAQLPMTREALPETVVNAVQSQQVTALMSPGLTEKGVDQIRNAMDAERDLAVARADWISSKTTEIASLVESMTPYYQEQAAVALARTEDIRDHIDELMKGIGSLDLYVGKDVEVVQITSGADAVEDIPLTLMQSKLYMDEELAVWEEVDETFDCNDRDQFFDALNLHQSLVDQIFATERCVVCVATSRRVQNYTERGYHALAAAALEEANKEVFLLVRNGGNIHVVSSPEVRHRFAKRLFPSTTEGDDVFRGIDGTRITYSDIRYTDALDEYEAIALGYKRLLILLCGLDHRDQLFGRFYPGEPSLDFVSMRFQEDYFSFIHDDDGTGLIAGDRRQPFREWLAGRNKLMQSGSRVVCLWSGLLNQDVAPGLYERESSHRQDYRSGPMLQYKPVNPSEVVVAKREKDRLVTSVLVAGTTVGSYEHREFQGKVDLGLAVREGASTSALCLDNVDPDDLRWYIHDRQTREMNVTHIRLFKRALAMLEADIQSEQADREALASALLEGAVADEQSIPTIVAEAFANYRCAKRGAPIAGISNDGSGWKKLLNLAYQLATTSADKGDLAWRTLQEEGRAPLRLVITASGTWAAYCVPLDDERDDRLHPQGWVSRIELTQSGSGFSLGKIRDAIFGESTLGEKTIIEADDAESHFSPSANILASRAQKSKLLEASNGHAGLIAAIAAGSLPADEFVDILAEWERVRHDVTDGNVENPRMAVPIGAFVANRRDGLDIGHVAIGAHRAEVALYHLAPTDELRKAVRESFLGIYRYPEKHEEGFDEAVREPMEWTLFKLKGATRGPASVFMTGYEGTATEARALPTAPGRQYSLQARIDEVEYSYIDPLIGGDVDAYFGIAEPDNYDPVAVCGFGHHMGFSDYYEIISFGDLESASQVRNYGNTVHFDTEEEGVRYVKKRGYRGKPFRQIDPISNTPGLRSTWSSKKPD